MTDTEDGAEQAFVVAATCATADTLPTKPVRARPGEEIG
jgi:hypothetical protein